MTFSRRSLILYSSLVLLLVLRFWQNDHDWRVQCGLFSQPTSGLWEGYVAEEPELFFDHRPGGHETGRKDGSYEPFVKETRAVCVITAFNGHSVQPVKIRCTFRLSSQVPQPIFSCGDRVEVQGKVQRPPPAMNPGQFDYAQYLKTKRVAYVCYASPGRWRKLEGEREGPFLTRWAADLKRAAEDRINRVLPYPQNALLTGILLGQRTALPDDVVESFFVTGTIHILAVSGMITAFVAGLFFLVFRALRFHRKWAALCAIVALVFFILMTGAHPPVCRAGLFSILALTAVLFERRVHGGALLLSTAYLLVLWNPFVVEDLSFQISFLATSGLMVMASWFLKKLSFLPQALAWLITASAAAQLAVWCLILYDFNQFSLYSVLSNVVIVPLALFVTAGGLALLAGSLFHPFLATLFGAGCLWPLKLLLYLASAMEHWPGAQFIVASPPLGWVLAFHALLLALFFFYWPRPRPIAPQEAWLKGRTFLLRGRRWAVMLMGSFLAASLSLWAWNALRSQPLRVTFLAVGHGNAVVLRSPQGKTFLVDGGKDSKGPDRYQTVVAYLRHEGVERVDGMLNTHPDADHVGGLLNVLRAYPVSIAYEGPLAHSDSRVYQLYEETLKQKGTKDLFVNQGDQLPGLTPARWTILHPALAYRPRLHEDNNRSVVSLITFGGLKMVLPGDLEKPGILEFLKKNPGLAPVDWLMAPHHGRASGQPALCEKGLDPSYVVLSDYKDYPETRDQYQAGGAIVLSTALDGAIEVEMNGDGRGRYRTYQDKAWENFRAMTGVH